MAEIVLGEPVPAELAESNVTNRDGDETTLGSFWTDGPAVVAFIRHFGCAGCAEHVAALIPRLGELERLGLRTVLVGNGAANFIEGFVERNLLRDRNVDVVTDPSLKAFDAAGLVRSGWSVIGPRGAKNLGRALIRGFRQGRVEGSNWQQGGSLVIDRRGRVAHYHRDRSLGDFAPPVELVDVAMRVAGAGRAVV